MLNSLTRTASVETDRAAELRRVYDAHKSFVWACLQRFGVAPVELEDLFQEVFLVVHQRLSTFEPGAPMRPWLFGIAMRVAANHRRRAYRRRELSASDSLDERNAGERSPETLAAESEARDTLAAILDRMALDKRAVFVMFEVEGLECQQIAEQIGIPVGTVYSRLHAARKTFEKELRAHRAGTRGARP